MRKQMLRKLVLTAVGCGIIGSVLPAMPAGAADWNKDTHNIYYLDGNENPYVMPDTQLGYMTVAHSFGVTVGASTKDAKYANATGPTGGDVIGVVDGTYVDQSILNGYIWTATNVFDTSNGVEKGYTNVSHNNANFTGILAYDQLHDYVAGVNSNVTSASTNRNKFFIQEGKNWIEASRDQLNPDANNRHYLMTLREYVTNKYDLTDETAITNQMDIIKSKYPHDVYSLGDKGQPTTDCVFVDYSHYDSNKEKDLTSGNGTYNSTLDIYTGTIRGNNWEYLVQSTKTDATTGLAAHAFWGYRFKNDAASTGAGTGGTGNSGTISTDDFNRAIADTFVNDTILYGRDITAGKVAAADGKYTKDNQGNVTTKLNDSVINLYSPGTQNADNTFNNDDLAFTVEFPNNVWYDNANQNSISFKNSSQQNTQNTIDTDTSYAIGANTIYGGTDFAVGGITMPNSIGTKAAPVIGALVYGSGNTVTADNATAIGNGTTVNEKNSVALGNASATSAVHTGDEATKLGNITYAGAPSTKNGSVSVGAKNNERQIQNVAAGRVAADSTDAINGSQLSAAITNLTKRATAATTKVTGGTNTVVTPAKNTDGSTTYAVDLKPIITLGTDPDKQVTVDGVAGEVRGLTNRTWVPGKTQAVHGRAATEDQLQAISDAAAVARADDGMKYSGDVGQAAVKLNKNVSVVGETATGKKLTTGNIGVEATQNGDNAKLVVKLADDLTGLKSVTTETVKATTVKVGDTVTINNNGIDAGDTKITSVKNGDVSNTSTDAVNGSQLYQCEQQTNIAITNLGNDLTDLSDRVDKVGAGAAALAALHPLDFDPDDKWDFSAGYGHYKGASAAAFGAFYRPNEDTMFSISATMGNGENLWNAGVSLKIGQGNHVSTSRIAMAKEIVDLRNQVKQLTGMVNSLLGVIDPSKTKLFPDVPENHWAYEYVAKLAGNGIVEGYPDGLFKGDRSMTRYEFAAVLYRAMAKGATIDGKLVKEFQPELERIRVDRFYPNDLKIDRVRVIPGRE